MGKLADWSVEVRCSHLLVTHAVIAALYELRNTAQGLIGHTCTCTGVHVHV